MRGKASRKAEERAPLATPTSIWVPGDDDGDGDDDFATAVDEECYTEQERRSLGELRNLSFGALERMVERLGLEIDPECEKEDLVQAVAIHGGVVPKHRPPLSMNPFGAKRYGRREAGVWRHRCFAASLLLFLAAFFFFVRSLPPASPPEPASFADRPASGPASGRTAGGGGEQGEEVDGVSPAALSGLEDEEREREWEGGGGGRPCIAPELSARVNLRCDHSPHSQPDPDPGP